MAANGWDNPDIIEGTRLRLRPNLRQDSPYEGFWGMDRVAINAQVRKLDRGGGTAEVVFLDADGKPMPRRDMPFVRDANRGGGLADSLGDRESLAPLAAMYSFDVSSLPSERLLFDEWLDGEWVETISLADYPAEHVMEPWPHKGLSVGDVVAFVGAEHGSNSSFSHVGSVVKWNDKEQILTLNIDGQDRHFDYARIDVTRNTGNSKARNDA